MTTYQLAALRSCYCPLRVSPSRLAVEHRHETSRLPLAKRIYSAPYGRTGEMVKKMRKFHTLKGGKEQSYNPKLTAARVALVKTESEIEKLLDTLSGANSLLLQYANTHIEELDAERQKQLKMVADLTANSGSNYHHYSDAHADELVDIVATEKDQDKRMEAGKELQTYLVDACPQVPLYIANLVIAYNKDLTGTQLFPGGNHDWSHAYVAK